VRVEHSPLELFNAFKVGHVGDVEVASAGQHVVESFRPLFSGSHGSDCSVFSDSDGEVVGLRVEFDIVDDGVEVDPVLDVGLLNAAIDVIVEHFTWGEGGDSLAEVLLERVVCEFQAFLRSI